MKMKMKKNNAKKILILLLAIVIIGVIIYIELAANKGSDNNTNETPIPTETTKIYNYGDFTMPTEGERPFAVMIDNATNEVLPHAGLYKAQLVYEILVEGGETRYMAVFWGEGSKEIGPVRSARHYYLDYAMENDAIYAHYGWSPFAQKDIPRFGINNINGLYSGDTYWRSSDYVSPHNAFTSTKKLKAKAKSLKYKTKTKQKNLFTYNLEDVVPTGGIKAKNITVTYNLYHFSSYEYSSKTKSYKRSRHGATQIEKMTGKQLRVKNIIIQKIPIHTIGNDNKGRQELSDVGSGSGYYITCGRAVKIKWSKTSRSAQTKYTLAKTGEKLILNPGNTWIQIISPDLTPKIK